MGAGCLDLSALAELGGLGGLGGHEGASGLASYADHTTAARAIAISASATAAADAGAGPAMRRRRFSLESFVGLDNNGNTHFTGNSVSAATHGSGAIAPPATIRRAEQVASAVDGDDAAPCVAAILSGYLASSAGRGNALFSLLSPIRPDGAYTQPPPQLPGPRGTERGWPRNAVRLRQLPSPAAGHGPPVKTASVAAPVLPHSEMLQPVKPTHAYAAPSEAAEASFPLPATITAANVNSDNLHNVNLQYEGIHPLCTHEQTGFPPTAPAPGANATHRLELDLRSPGKPAPATKASHSVKRALAALGAHELNAL